MFYLDHEEQVKFVDGVLAHSQEWQWLIDIIGEKAEFKDIDSWGDFVRTLDSHLLIVTEEPIYTRKLTSLQYCTYIIKFSSLPTCRSFICISQTHS